MLGNVAWNPCDKPLPLWWELNHPLDLACEGKVSKICPVKLDVRGLCVCVACAYHRPQKPIHSRNLFGGIHLGIHYRRGAEKMFGELIWA